MSIRFVKDPAPLLKVIAIYPVFSRLSCEISLFTITHPLGGVVPPFYRRCALVVPLLLFQGVIADQTRGEWRRAPDLYPEDMSFW